MIETTTFWFYYIFGNSNFANIGKKIKVATTHFKGSSIELVCEAFPCMKSVEVPWCWWIQGVMTSVWATELFLPFWLPNSLDSMSSKMTIPLLWRTFRRQLYWLPSSRLCKTKSSSENYWVIIVSREVIMRFNFQVSLQMSMVEIIITFT